VPSKLTKSDAVRRVGVATHSSVGPSPAHLRPGEGAGLVRHPLNRKGDGRGGRKTRGKHFVRGLLWRADRGTACASIPLLGLPSFSCSRRARTRVPSPVADGEGSVLLGSEGKVTPCGCDAKRGRRRGRRSRTVAAFAGTGVVSPPVDHLHEPSRACSGRGCRKATNPTDLPRAAGPSAARSGVDGCVILAPRVRLMRGRNRS